MPKGSACVLRILLRLVIGEKLCGFATQELWDQKRERAWFGESDGACAVVLDFDREPVGLLYYTSSSYDVSVLFAEALKRHAPKRFRKTH